MKVNLMAIIFWLGIAIAIGNEYGLTWFGISLTFPMFFDMAIDFLEKAINAPRFPKS